MRTRDVWRLWVALMTLVPALASADTGTFKANLTSSQVVPPTGSAAGASAGDLPVHQYLLR